MSRIRLALGVAALVAGSVLTVASPAMADDPDDSLGADSSTTGLVAEDAKTGVPTAGRATDCIGPDALPEGTGCFQRPGDHIYVKDTDNNGRTFYVYYQLYLKTSAGTWKLRRAGLCFASGVNHWAQCDYDFYEWNTLNAYGGSGAGVRIYLCETDSGCSPYYKWVRNNE